MESTTAEDEQLAAWKKTKLDKLPFYVKFTNIQTGEEVPFADGRDKKNIKVEYIDRDTKEVITDQQKLPNFRSQYSRIVTATTAKLEAAREADRQRRPSQKVLLERAEAALAKALNENKDLKKQLKEQKEKLEEKDNIINVLTMSSAKKKHLRQVIQLFQKCANEKDKVEREAQRKKEEIDRKYQEREEQLTAALDALILEEEAEDDS